MHLHVALHPEAQLDEVAAAMAIAAGAAHHFVDIGGVPVARVNSLETRGIVEVPQMARIIFTAGDGESLRFQYHFELRRGWRGLLIPETARGLAISKALVRQFGGTIELARDGVPRILEVDSRWPPSPEGGEGFAELQRLVRDVHRVTAEDIQEAAAELTRHDASAE